MSGHLEWQDRPAASSPDGLLRAALRAEKCDFVTTGEGTEFAYTAACDGERLWWVSWALGSLGFRHVPHSDCWSRRVPK